MSDRLDEWTCVCGYNNSDVRSRCRGCGTEKSVGDGTPGPARTNAPEFPKYVGYDGPRIVQRLNYAADVLDLLAKWIGAKPSLPHRDLIQLAKDFRSMADEELEELWPK